LTEGKYEREAWRVRKDGSLFWGHVLIDPIFDEAGKHVGFAKVTRDATERKQAQEELERTRAALAQSQKLQALGELAGGVAHDFNNLMTVIVGSADFLRRRPNLSPEKRQQYVDAIYDTGTRATKLTDQLLAFGRRRPLRAEVLDVNSCVDALSDMLRRTLGSRIKVELSLADDVGRVEVDAAQLESALLNAAINARDAMPNGGTLTIATSKEAADAQEFVRIDVRDTGLGMPQRVLERAFDPFFTTKEVGEGTGLGLSQIHGFAAQAGGSAELSSEEGAGTTVSLLLPRTGKNLTRSHENRTSQTLSKGTRVLLVEDNAQVRAFANDLLQDLGCEVLCAASGDEALACLADADVDVVLSDIVMPGMSGIELASRVKQARPRLPVVLATGYSEQAAQTSQPLPIILKPYSGTDLSAALAQAIAASATDTASTN
jgi:signal transduction histidine kinase/CheY-like chemotaxis protein